ncbi:MAG: response regulator [Jatrophihabitans sp.]|uniref:response regulator n=1 Tax=Jatrophihabitans sp. TaxID=1932789 RepID=UPI003F822600
MSDDDSAGTVPQSTGAEGRRARIRLFLLDDHEIVRAGLADLLRTVGPFEIVGEAGTVAQAREGILATVPDIAVLDVRLPDGSGIDLCRQLRSLAPEVRSVLLTSFEETDAAAAAVIAGAYGYFLKEVHVSDLAEVLQRVIDGERVFDPIVVERALDALRGDPLRDQGGRELSEREQLVRDLLLAGLTDREIAARLQVPERTARILVADVLARVLSGA